MFGNISKMLEMKKKAEEMKAKIAHLRVEKQFLGVTIVLTGLNKIESIRFVDDFFENKTKAEIEEALVLAINSAQDELGNQLKDEFSDLTGGLGL